MSDLQNLAAAPPCVVGCSLREEIGEAHQLQPDDLEASSSSFLIYPKVSLLSLYNKVVPLCSCIGQQYGPPAVDLWLARWLMPVNT